MLEARRQALFVAFLELGDSPGSERVGADFIDHRLRPPIGKGLSGARAGFRFFPPPGIQAYVGGAGVTNYRRSRSRNVHSVYVPAVRFPQGSRGDNASL